MFDPFLEKKSPFHHRFKKYLETENKDICTETYIVLSKLTSLILKSWKGTKNSKSVSELEIYLIFNAYMSFSGIWGL